MHENCQALVARARPLGVAITTSVLGARMLRRLNRIHIVLLSSRLLAQALVRSIVGPGGRGDQRISAAVLEVAGNVPTGSVGIANRQHSRHRVR